ncbi:MAG: 4Fe-4S dicluster domain-containing protein [Chloroflexia bacterium]|nr:4Fe-4S dicluster domain-containing protein [Chloroflexia bacterium]
MINIDHYKFPEKIDFDEHTLIGICGPTHGFNFPPIVINFLFRFPNAGKANVFILNTRAGMKLYKLFLPGLSGLAQYLAAIVMRLKGYRIVGMQPMDLPSNWISLHPGLHQKVVESIFHRCKRITTRFANKILDGKTVYKALISLPIDLAIAPVSFGYYLVGRFAIAKTFIATDACTNCGLCEKKCPVGAIKNSEVRPYWTFDCESCMHCMNHCPERAIETALGFTAILWWIAFSLIPISLLKIILDANVFGVNEHFWLSKLIYYFIFIGGGLFIVFLAYRILHFLMRFTLFSKIITYTSLTKYKFWRRYKAPKNI